MNVFNESDLKKLYIAPKDSHKGQNGKLMIIGGSRLFHGASLWALKVASRIVDMVFYASTEENNKLAQQLKSNLYDFIAIPREKIPDYINEADAILLGPGLPREEGRSKNEQKTAVITEQILKTYQDHRFIIDAGSLTEMNPDWLLGLNGKAILVPHPKEFQMLFQTAASDQSVESMAKKYNCIVVLKGHVDTVCSPLECVRVEGGNSGMTKGGTGDVVAGLIAALACKNDMFLAAKAGSFINKKAGESLYKRVGPYFNASDLCDEVPKVMFRLLVP